MKKILQAAAVAIVAGMAFAPAHALVIGAADGSNSIPLGSTLGGYYYQQVYNASSFGAGLNINQITFYNTVSPGGSPRSGDFAIYLSTTSANIATFDTDINPWFDASYTLVYSGALPATADGRLDLMLSSAFNYNPLDGNLLLTIREFTLAGEGTLFLDTDVNNGVTNSRFSAYPYNWDQGLVTGFNDAVAPAPEPATCALVLAGVGSLAVSRRRRKAQAN